MTHVIHRNARQEYPFAVAGDGVYIIDAEGKRYLDASGSAAVSCLGYSDREVIAALKAQLDKLCFVHSSFFTTEPMEALAEDLVSDAPGGLAHVYFVCGGSEAIEAALKLARQYFVELGEPHRTTFIARKPSYHGDTLGAVSAGYRQANREKFGPLMFEGAYVSSCYAYREARPQESDAAYAARLGADLEAEIQRIGSEKVIAFIAETVSGSSLGAVPPVPGYFRRAREICDKYGILLILDEIMCGMGRCGTRYTYSQEGIAPDILTIAKGLGAGYQPIGATLCSDRVYQPIVNGSGSFSHGQTYIGHAAGCAAALAVQRAVRGRRVIDHVRRLAPELEAMLRTRFGSHPHVGDIRGRGLLLGIEFVADRATKEPFDAKFKLSAKVKANAMKSGLLCNAYSGHVDGTRGDHVLLAPPFIIEEKHITEIGDKLEVALRETFHMTAST